MRARLLVLTLTALLVVSATQFVQAAESAAALPIYNSPESFSAQHRQADYLPHAKQFLANHPHDPRATRVAMDLLMVATLTQQPAEIKAAKLHLLLQYPESLPTGYVVKTSTAKDVAALLKERFTDATTTLDRETLKRFVRAVDLCHRTFGPSFCDDDLWAQCALAAQDARISIAMQAQIKKRDSDAAKTVAIIINTQLDLRAKFVELQALRNYNTARAFQRFIFSELTDDERADPAVRIVVVENLLHDRKLAEALPLLSELCKTEHDPRLLFWYGWAQAATGDTTAAQATFEKVTKDFPGDAWATTAAELAPLMKNLQAVLDEHCVALGSAAATLATPPEVLEATVGWTGDKGTSQIYVGVDLQRDAMELFSSKASQAQFAYSVGPSRSRYYTQGDTSIHQFQTPGLCPVFNVAVQMKPSGGFDLNFNFNTLPQGNGALPRSFVELLKHPFFASTSGRRQHLEHALRSGNIPMPISKSGDSRQLRWVTPGIDEPRPQYNEVSLAEDHRIVGISSGNWAVKDIRYGSRATAKLSPPAWPDLPVASTAEMGATDMFRLLAAVMSIMGADDKPTAEVADGSPEELPQLR